MHVALPSADQIAARELNADEQVKQAIERLTWGPRPGLYDTVRAMGVDRWVYRQLEPARIHDPAADQFVAQFPLLTTSIPSLLSEIPTPGQEKKAAGAAPTAADSAAMKKEAERSRKLLTDLQAAKVGRALISERQLDEVMVDFWFNHFNVFAGKGPERYYLPAYERMAIRPYALGKFRSLLGAVAQSPAMLFYLDNWESRANANEPTLAAAPAAGGGGGAVPEAVIPAPAAPTRAARAADSAAGWVAVSAAAVRRRGRPRPRAAPIRTRRGAGARSQ